MLKISKIYFKLIDLFIQYKYLNVVSLKRTLFLILITILVMIFDALSIISIMPLVQFIQVGQDVNSF